MVATAPLYTNRSDIDALPRVVLDQIRSEAVRNMYDRFKRDPAKLYKWGAVVLQVSPRAQSAR